MFLENKRKQINKSDLSATETNMGNDNGIKCVFILFRQITVKYEFDCMCARKRARTKGRSCDEVR